MEWTHLAVQKDSNGKIVDYSLARGTSVEIASNAYERNPRVVDVQKLMKELTVLSGHSVEFMPLIQPITETINGTPASS